MPAATLNGRPTRKGGTGVETRLAVIAELPTGDRAVYTMPVRVGMEDIAAARAESIRAARAADLGCTVRIDTFTHAVSAR